MDMKLDSSAPYIKNASTRESGFLDWGDHLEPIDGQSSNFGRLLWRGDADDSSEAGIWNATPGSWHLVTPRDE
ncbi:MAG: cupin, partial [Alphaproteobacteria bacterium]|nr:cupin [Alphaproteobacteria bacterium]